MIKFTRRLRDRNQSKQLFAYLVLFWGIVGVGFQTLRSLLGESPLEYTLVTHFYFTTQSNILLVIVSLLYLFKKKKGNGFTSLSFITLINISVTGIVFHTLLTPFMSNVSFLNHVLHTINPLLYIIFYFMVIEEHLPVSKFWISLIYPLIYMALVYLIIEPVFGDLMEELMTTFESARYVYPFLDPSQYERGIVGLILFNLGLLAPAMILLAFVLNLLKSRFETRLRIT